MKTLLIVSGGREAVHAASLAKQLGYYVVVSDGDIQAPAFAHADSCLIADWRNPNETPAAAERFSRKVRKVDGVIAAEPAAIVTTAETCERLSVPGLSSTAAKFCADRLLARERLLAAGMPLPWFSSVETPQALQRIAIERGTPLVIKPADGHNSRAQQVIRAEDLERSYQTAQGQSPTWRVMAEEFLPPPHVTAAGLVVNGRCHTLAVADRSTDEDASPFLLHSRNTMPSVLPPERLARVDEIVAKGVAALGIDSGAVEGVLALAGEELRLLSLRAQLLGDIWCRQIALSTGVDLRVSAIKVALGETLAAEDVVPKRVHPAVAHVRFAPVGRIIGISGEERARQVTGVRELALLAQPGDVTRQNEAPMAAAVVLAAGPSREAAESAAREALSLLRIEVSRQ